MKKYINSCLFLAVLFVAAGCEKEPAVYNAADNRLNFYLKYGDVITTSYSFVYHGDVVEDTVWLKLLTLGFVEDEDRPFELEQVMTGENDAVAGTHYLPFDDERLKPFYVIPAGAVEVEAPVVVLRDKSLKEKEVTLKVAVKENACFKRGYEANRFRIIELSDVLAKPQKWDKYYLDYSISIYTQGIHRFMIDETGETWDDEYIESACFDSAFCDYIATWLHNRLDEVNAQRIAAGQDVLREANGDPVEFVVRSWW